MRAHSSVCVTAPDGRSRLARLRSRPPLALRPTGPERVHLVASAAGPLGGDDLRLDVHIGQSARLVLRGLGAMLALPDPEHRPASLRYRVRVSAGGSLDARLPPTILGRDCLLHSQLRIELEPGAELVWSEVTVLGRHAEPPGRGLQSLSVTSAGRPLLRTSTDLTDPARYGSPAVLGPARALGYALVVPGSTVDSPAGAPVPRGEDACRGAVHQLEGASLVGVVGPDARQVADHLDALTAGYGRAGAAAGTCVRPADR